MSQDKFQLGKDTTSPLIEAYAVTPADGTDLAYTTRGLYIGVGGNITVDMCGPMTGSDAFSKNVATTPMTVTFTGVLAGTFLPIAVRRVRSTGTTATNIVALL